MRVFSLALVTSILFLIKKNVCYTECDGTSECSGLTMNDNYFYCYGYEACSGANITATLGVFCSGYYGCGEYTSSSASNIYAGNALYCSGDSSCYNSNISSGSFMFCSGENSCKNSNIKQATYLYGESYLSNYNSKIYNTRYIYGLGYKSFYYANIIVNNNYARTDIMLSGYYSGKNASVYCYSGSKCVLDCSGNACTDTTMYCYSGSTCNYIVSSISGVSPVVYTSLTPMMDQELNNMIAINDIEKKKEIKQLEEEKKNSHNNGRREQTYFETLGSTSKTDLSSSLVSNFNPSIISYGVGFIVIMTVINIIMCYNQHKNNKSAYAYQAI